MSTNNPLNAFSHLALRICSFHVGISVTEGGKGGYLSRTTEKLIKTLTTLTSILLLFDDLRKSEVEEREKRARRWCHNYLFLMSLLQVSNDINHHVNFKGQNAL